MPFADVQRGDCFDLAHLLASVLLGAGYSAYVVMGYAPHHIVMNDLSNTICPDIATHQIQRQDPKNSSDERRPPKAVSGVCPGSDVHSLSSNAINGETCSSTVQQASHVGLPQSDPDIEKLDCPSPSNGVIFSPGDDQARQDYVSHGHSIECGSQSLALESEDTASPSAQAASSDKAISLIHAQLSEGKETTEGRQGGYSDGCQSHVPQKEMLCGPSAHAVQGDIQPSSLLQSQDGERKEEHDSNLDNSHAPGGNSRITDPAREDKKAAFTMHAWVLVLPSMEEVSLIKVKFCKILAAW